MSNSPRRKVFGVDLGTTYSCVSHVDKHGQPVVIRDHHANNDLTPSVVYFQDGADPQMPGETVSIVGQLAKENGSIEPDRVVSLVKQKMHDKGWSVTIDGQEWDTVQISSLILEHVCARASETLNEPVTDVVITVPAYFGPLERGRTFQAGQAAGLNVHDILTEPMAAVLAYAANEGDDTRNVLVYDLGGGTFDVTILRLGAEGTHQRESLATTGDHQLGGCLWDNELARHWASAIDENLWRDDDKARNDLLIAAENAKKSLSTGKPRSSPQMLRRGDQHHTLTIEASKFDSLTQGLLNQTMELVEDALTMARKKDPDLSIDLVLLVGGSTLMPQVHARVEQFFGDAVEIKRQDPHFAVAKGAAIFAQNREVETWLKDFVTLNADRYKTADGSTVELDAVDAETMRRATEAASQHFGLDSAKVAAIARDPEGFADVSPVSFGVTHVTRSNRVDLFVTNLITAQQRMPASGSTKLETIEDDQRTVRIHCVQNDRDLGPDDDPVPYDPSERIGEAVLELDPGLKAGSKIKLMIEFTSTGLVKLYGKDLTNGREVRAEFEAPGLMDEAKLAAAKAQVAAARAVLPDE